ncbi:MAG: hypothetical protein ABW047_13500 [Nitrospiraceae bacterium]
MVGHDLHWVAFPTLDDIQVATLAKFGTCRPLLDGEALFQAGARDHRPDYSDHSHEMVCRERDSPPHGRHLVSTVPRNMEGARYGRT